MYKKINQLVKRYFLAFQKKNISKLEVLFEERIILNDWNNFIRGKKRVVIFNKKIFSKFKKIKINIKKIFYDKKTSKVACIIDVILDKTKIRVIDVIYFSKKMKIKKIEAYKL